MSKEGLQKVIQQEQMESHSAQVLNKLPFLDDLSLQFALKCMRYKVFELQGNFLSMEDLRDLFSFHENVRYALFLKLKLLFCVLQKMSI